MTPAHPATARGGRRRLALVAGLALALALITPGGAAVAIALPDPAADAGGQLDLTDAVLEQRDVRMFLRIATSGTWTHTDVTGTPGRSLCVTLAGGDPAIARGRICLATRARKPALSYTPLAADGSALATRRLGARVTQPAPGIVQATFLPVAAGLAVGSYAWSVQSEWTDGSGCASTCGDRLPDAGAVPAQLGLLGFPPCFGAAARDPDDPCENPDLRLTVEPQLSRASALLDPFCDKRMRPGLLSICAFGAAPGDAAGTFALIGDSHAASLKTALEVVTLGKRWRGYSIFRATCPATRARPILRTRSRSRQCVRWNGQVLGWLRGHRDVQTIFLSAHAIAQVASDGSRGMAATARDGYRDEIRTLLRLVRRVVVIRDVPPSPPDHLRCVAQALKNAAPPGPACTQPRSAAVRGDPLVTAASSLHSPRVHVIDLTNHFCDARRCFAVVGGALVQHDPTHLTSAFSASLGPYILGALGG